MFEFGSHTRADGSEVAPRTDVTLSQTLGLEDRRRPNEEQIRRQLRGTLEACLRKRAELFARSCTPGGGHQGLMVKRETTDGMERVEESHPWLQLIRQPNQYRSAYDFWYWMRFAADVQGTAPNIVREDALGTPDALLEVFPSFGRMNEKLNVEGGTAGYVYHRSDGQNIPLDADDVVQVKRTDPTTAHGSISILESLIYEVASDRAAAEYRHKTYSEGRPPLLYMSTDQELSPESAQEQGTRFKNEYMRPGGDVKGVPVMYGGMDLQSLGIDPDTFQMLESQELDHEVIFRVTGINSAYLDQGSNRAEAEQAERSILTGTIQPLLNQAAAQLTLSFRRAFGAEEGLRVVAPDVTPVDREQQAEIHSTQLETGAKTLNDIRRELGEEEYDADVADEPLVSSTLVPASEAGMSSGPSPEPEREDPPDFL
jgi:HK97 family phage portal protein